MLRLIFAILLDNTIKDRLRQFFSFSLLVTSSRGEDKIPSNEINLTKDQNQYN